MHWVFLGISTIFEIGLALASNWAQGFTRFWPTVVTILVAAGGIYTLSLALRVIDVSVGYTIWTGVGSVGTVIMGAILFGERINAIKIAGFASIIVGVVGLQMVTDF
jgi:quaternary ammonium compound-resistance protein SugE